MTLLIVLAAYAAAPPAETAGPGELLEFAYDWPEEATAIPALRQRFERERAAENRQAIADAREDQRQRPPEVEFIGHSYSKSWASMGQSPRLLSLAAELYTFTGGAHGNTSWDAIVWDRRAGRQIPASGLFAKPAAFQALSRPYCTALDEQRAEKRGESLPLSGDDWLIRCPSLAKQAVVPVDTDENGRFDTFRVLIAPYEAGPYVEGSYEVDVPVTPAIRASLRPEYRADFD